MEHSGAGGRSAKIGYPAPVEPLGDHAPHAAAGHHHSGLVWLALFVVIALMIVQLPPIIARQDSVVHTYSALVEVDALAKQKFVEPIASDRLVEGAIRGMLLELDPYSGYLSPEELPLFERRKEGRFIGVGLELGMRDNRLTVIAPIDGSPAAAAGILPGDALISVNGADVKDRSVFDVEEMLTGPAQTVIELVVQQPQSPEPRTVRIIRGPVAVRSVQGFRRSARGDWDYLLDPEWRIGYIRVSSFHETTMSEFDAALAALHRAAARALILDLRFNPGGLMDEAVDMVDRFVNKGLILATVTRRKAVNEYRARPAQTKWESPLVVLINGGSASSAEIVAGALQSHHRAVIVGERSFGKGSVQHLIPLTGLNAAVKLTVAYYRLPDGRIIHRTQDNASSGSWGILPDVEVRLSPQEQSAIAGSRRQLDRFVRPSSDTASADSPLALEGLIDAQLRAGIEQARIQLQLARLVP